CASDLPTAAPPMTSQMTVAPTCAAEYFSPARTSTRCDVGCSTGAPVAYCLCRSPYGPYWLSPPYEFDEPSLLSPDIDTPPEIACPAGYRAAQGYGRRRPPAPHGNRGPSSHSGRWDQKPMPPMSPAPPAGAAGSGSGLSATTASVVRNRPAIEPAFCSA